MVATVGENEAKVDFAKLLRRVEAGETIIITRHGKPVARFAPAVREVATADERRALIEAWRRERKGLTLGGLKIRDLINEGRR